MESLIEPDKKLSTGNVREQGLVLPFLALLVGAVAMGVSPIFVRLADVGPFSSAFWRVALALPVLYAWMRIDERALPIRAAAFQRVNVLAGAVFAGDLFFWHLAIMKTTVADATFFATTAPLWVVIFGWLLLRERVSSAVLTGLGLCILGGAGLLAQSLRAQVGTALGDAYGLGAGIFFGLYFLVVQAARRKTSAARVTFEATAVSAVLLLAAALILEHRLLPRSIHGWMALIAVAWISQAGGQGLLAAALGRLPATFSSLVIFLEAVAAAFFGWAVLGERVTMVQACGGLTIMAGIYVARPRKQRP